MRRFLAFMCVAAMAVPTLRAADRPDLKLVRVNSEEPNGEDGKGVNAVDGNPETIWHTQWSDGAFKHPHEIVLQLNTPGKIEGLSYLPRQDGNVNGMIRGYEIYLSEDGRDFGQPVKKGEFGGGGDMKFALFDSKRCSHVKLVALSSVSGDAFTSAAEIGIVTADTFRAMKTAAENVVPLAGKPFDVPKDPAAKKVLIQQIKGYMAMPPEMVRAHRSAADYPGIATRNSARVTREVTFSVPAAGQWNGWQGTGLFANAGEMVTVTPVNPLPEGVTIEIRIGCHTREVFSDYFTTWERFPTLVRTFTLAKRAMPVASAFGGNIYVVVNTAEGAKAGGSTVALRFTNAVEAPYFVLGKTKLADWRRLRAAPAPQGELVGNSTVLHLPSSLLRNLSDPTALMTWWDKVVTAQDELAAWPARITPERVVFERQMGGAWGLSGYPVLIHPDGAAHAADLAGLRKDGDWGIFHEIGHNHQSDEWTFYANPILEQTEVTVNFFSLYCMEHIVGKPRGTGHPAIEGDELFKNLTKRFGNKPSDDAFEQLAPFVVLIQQFGWEPMKKTIASYRSSPLGDEVPEVDRQAEFVKRYSQYAKADLGAFFRKSGFAVSRKVQNELKTLPEFDYVQWRKDAKGK